MKNLTETEVGFYESIESCSVKLACRKVTLKLCVEIINLEDAAGEEGFLVISSLVVVPKSLTSKQRRKLMNFSGGNVTLYDVQHYGYCVMFASEKFKTKEQAIAFVEESIDKNVSIILDEVGFILDRPVNCLGKTGWDLLNRQFENEKLANALL